MLTIFWLSILIILSSTSTFPAVVEFASTFVTVVPPSILFSLRVRPIFPGGMVTKTVFLCCLGDWSNCCRVDWSITDGAVAALFASSASQSEELNCLDWLGWSHVSISFTRCCPVDCSDIASSAARVHTAMVPGLHILSLHRFSCSMASSNVSKCATVHTSHVKISLKSPSHVFSWFSSSSAVSNLHTLQMPHVKVDIFLLFLFGAARRSIYLYGTLLASSTAKF
mmetsp:Transcript_19507/g.39122  ORF Transcript_19507/g.39122 Transcript_19507/m.39122 type:complete len:225 (-) Transcript_19507:74-748(-)